MRPENPIHRLGEFFKKMLAIREIRKFEKKMKEGKEAEKERQDAETREKRDREKEEREREERGRPYHDIRSGEETVETEEQYKNLEVAQVEQALNEFLTNFNNGQQGGEDVKWESAGYIYDYLSADTTRRDRLMDLVRANPVAGEVVRALVSPGGEVHSDPGELLKLGQRLVFQADKAGRRADVAGLVNLIRGQVQSLVNGSIEKEALERAAAGGRRETAIFPHERLIDQFPGLTDQQKAALRNPATAPAVINDLFTQAASANQASWTDTVSRAIAGKPPKALVDECEPIWGEIQQKSKSGALSASELSDYYQQLITAETKHFPKDITPNSIGYNNTVKASREYIKEKQNTLARELARQLKNEPGEIKGGLNEKEFLEAIILHPGRLGEYLVRSDEIKRLLLGNSEKSVRFRNRVFLQIHSNILRETRRSSRDTFGLYERANLTTFLDFLDQGMSAQTREETREKIGSTWANWYSELSETIAQSRDVDFWASQPGADPEGFNKSIGLFQNEYSALALTMPGVEQAYRALWVSLRSIQASNDGYIPPDMIEYNAPDGTAHWDRMSINTLEKFIKAGQVHDVKRDRFGFLEKEEDGHSVKLGNPLNWEELDAEDPKQLELKMYMTLAKGFGMVSTEFLNVFANTKCPGSDQPNYSMDGFHSTAYEPVARAGNFYNLVTHKWKFGNKVYFPLMNQLLPTDKKLSIEGQDFKEAYIHYRKGDFKEFMQKKYGLTEKDAKSVKRLIDLQNFSGNSSAWGPPYTGWRFLDVTIGWSDRKRIGMGASARIMYASRFAGEKVKQFLVAEPYRRKFRQEMAAAGKPTAGPEFEILWQRYRGDKINAEIEEEWEKIKGIEKTGPAPHWYHHHHSREEADALEGQYAKAYRARVWIEAAMRNPLAVAHNVKVSHPDPAFSDKKITLHQFIIQDVLGIKDWETTYGIIPGSDGTSEVTVGASPTKTQMELINTVHNLETDLALVREKVFQDPDNPYRDLTDDDFNIIKDETSRKMALKYWRTVKQVMMGSENGNPEDLYRKLGMTMGEDGYYKVEWEEKKNERGEIETYGIKNIDKVFKEIADHTTGVEKRDGKPVVQYTLRDSRTVDLPFLLTSDFADKEWEHMFGTDDVVFRKMDILNLGSRNWVRRGGDWQAHYLGGQKSAEYLTDVVNAKADQETLVKKLWEVRKAYEGDMIEAGWQVASYLGFATAKLFSWNWKRLGSPMQLDVIGKRTGVPAWFANGRRKFWDLMEHYDVIPPNAYCYYPSVNKNLNIHNLRRLNHAEDHDVWTEILLGAAAMAVALTFYRAFTAKDEEESGGGGGHE